jgi:DNA-directed RNA polymerase subunit E"
MEKACKTCKRIVTKRKCPVCGSTDLVKDWKGIIYIFDPDRSEIAKKMNIKMPGQYALKLR